MVSNNPNKIEYRKFKAQRSDDVLLETSTNITKFAIPMSVVDDALLVLFVLSTEVKYQILRCALFFQFCWNVLLSKPKTSCILRNHRNDVPDDLFSDIGIPISSIYQQFIIFFWTTFILFWKVVLFYLFIQSCSMLQ